MCVCVCVCVYIYIYKIGIDKEISSSFGIDSLRSNRTVESHWTTTQ